LKHGSIHSKWIEPLFLHVIFFLFFFYKELKSGGKLEIDLLLSPIDLIGLLCSDLKKSSHRFKLDHRSIISNIESSTLSLIDIIKIE